MAWCRKSLNLNGLNENIWIDIITQAQKFPHFLILKIDWILKMRKSGNLWAQAMSNFFNCQNRKKQIYNTNFHITKIESLLFSNVLNKQQSYDMQHWHINKNTEHLIFFTGCNKAVKMKHFVNMMTCHFQWKQLDDHGLVPGNLTSDVTVPAGCVLQLRPLGIPSPDPWMLYIS